MSGLARFRQGWRRLSGGGRGRALRFATILLIAGCSSVSPTSPPTGSVTPPTVAPPPTTVVPTATTVASEPTPTVAPTATPVAREPIAVVAAENFYGDVASQVGGERVKVVSILADPSVDPHEYESNVDDAKAVAGSRLVIKNGLGYDAFVDKLLAASPRPNRLVLDVGELTGRKDGDNPHVWYDPATMPRLARALADAYTRIDPAEQEYFVARLQAFLASERAVDDAIARFRAHHAGARVLATEPVFDDMAEALGLVVVDKGGAFQRSVEEGIDPPASAVAAFRRQITSRSVRALLYNRQAVTPLTVQLQNLAKANQIPVVPISETEPGGKTYQQWMLDQLKSLQDALEA